MNKLVALAVFFPAIAGAGLPRHKEPTIEKAPPPAAILEAKTVYLRNGQTNSAGLTKGGNELAFDALYSDMKQWGKYALVGSPERADLVIELRYGASNSGPIPGFLYNPSTGGVHSYTYSRESAFFSLVVSEARSGQELWSESDRCGTAYRVKNQRKEVVKSVGRLVDRLKQMGG